MWAYELTAPRQFSRTEIPEPETLGPGEVLVRLLAGGICGSDVPKFVGIQQYGKRDAPGPGYPMHEIAGVVEQTADARFSPGDRVSGYAQGQAGLRQFVATPGDCLTHAPDGMTAIQSTAIQPLSTVMFALDRLPDVGNRDVLVVGLGPIGLLFCHVLHQAGARVIGVDPVDRSAVAEDYGIDELFVGGIEDWRPSGAAPSICIEAVGHQQETLTHSVTALGQEGHLLAFGVPDDETYTFPMRAAFDRGIAVYFGTTPRWEAVLTRAAAYLGEHRDILDTYITHVLPPDRATEAYTLATTAAIERRKVVIDAS